MDNIKQKYKEKIRETDIENKNQINELNMIIKQLEMENKSIQKQSNMYLLLFILSILFRNEDKCVQFQEQIIKLENINHDLMNKLEEKKLTLKKLEEIEDKYNELVSDYNNLKSVNEQMTNDINEYISKLNENEHIISKYEKDNFTLKSLIKEYNYIFIEYNIYFIF